jgi:catechol 2,3-dioxygenase-like lactoylglutathione lyase family enzyme
MTAAPASPPVLELRVALTTADYERLLRFYTLGLGLEPAADWSGPQGRVVMVALGPRHAGGVRRAPGRLRGPA